MVKKLTNEEKRRLDIAQRAGSVDIDELVIPEWLAKDDLASIEFTRVYNNFVKIGLLDNLDLGILAGYCNAYSHYVAMVRDTQKNGDVIEKADRYGNIAMANNPAVKLADIYYAQMLKASQKLGLSSVDRLKLIDLDNVKRSKNKFNDLLAEKYGGV